MKFKLLTFLLLSTNIIYSQKEDYAWVMGGPFEDDSLGATCLIDFGFSPPLMEYLDEFPAMDLTNTNVSTPDGELLFYTNGTNLYNGQHEIVENGEKFQTALQYMYGYYTIQGGIIIPFPGRSGQYVFILCDDVIYGYDGKSVHGCHPLTYSIIKDNGMGGVVTEKKSILYNDTLHYNQMQGIKHANGRDWWMVCAPNIGSNRYTKFLLTPDGIGLDDIQHIGEPYWKQWGQGAVSPDGEWIAHYNLSADGSPDYAFYVDLFRFDRCSGQLYDHLQMIYPQEGATGGIAFSPDSKKMYVADGVEIFQFDLEAPDIKASRLEVATYDGFLDEWGLETYFSLMKLAPNGKIYICSTTIGTQYMHVIESPNELGMACDVQQHSVFLPARNHRSLPHHPTYRLGPLEGSPCDTLDFTPAVEHVQVEAFQVFPNPFRDALRIDFEGQTLVDAEVMVYDIIGNTLKRLPLQQEQNTFFLGDLQAGIYFYEIWESGVLLDSGKLVKVE